MSETTEPDFLGMSGPQRGVEAIKECHRIVRRNIIAGAGGDADAAGRTQTALDLLQILRPEMTKEAVILAAVKRIQEGS